MEEPSGSGQDGGAMDRVAEELTAAVYKAFGELRARNMEPNEACAMSIRIGAGAASLPPSLSDLAAAIAAAQEEQCIGSGSGSSGGAHLSREAAQQLEKQILKFFGSLDAVQASFWPGPQPEPLVHVTPSPAAAAAAAAAAATAAGITTAISGAGKSSSSSGNSGSGSHGHEKAKRRGPGDSPALAFDCGAAMEAYAAVASLRSDTLMAALETATSRLVSEIASAHRSSSSGPHITPIPGAGAGNLFGAFGGVHTTYIPDSILFPTTSGGTTATAGAHTGVGSSSGGGATAAAADLPPPGPGVCASPAALCRGVAAALLSPVLEDPGGHPSLEALARAVAAWPAQQRDLLLQLLRRWGAAAMGRAVGSCQSHITLTLYTRMAITPGVEAVTALLGLLSRACEQSGVLPHSEFYNGAVNADDFNVQEDFRRWKMPHRYPFSFCRHPFVYDPASKARVLQLENQMIQHQHFETGMMQAIMGGAPSPYFVLRVRRGPHLLRDTLLQVNRAKDRGDLRKPLKVQFVGEDGVDEGGVQKEFFQLLVRAAFNPDYGMFRYDDSTRLHWFRPSRLDMDTEFELVGTVVGLAIYNSHILEFQFPMALYKKMTGHPLGLEDLEELAPEVHRSLSRLQQMSPEEVEALALTFEVETEVGFGEMEAVELLPNGSTQKVTPENRRDYARLYALHLLEGSVGRQLGAFLRGFARLCSGDALSLFRPAELEQLVCGCRTLDLSALEAVTLYEDGYHSGSPAVRWFWEVAHSLDETQRKRLLFFITGSDRVPIKGLGALVPPFVIQRNGDRADRLPTAQTCFNHLLLPSYRDRETLRARLLLAIENAEGFGLV